MKKVIISNATLEVVLQDSGEFSETSCPSGVISITGENNVKFEQSVGRSSTDSRNPKLLDGQYLSLTRKKNGKYSFNMKTLEFSPGLDGKAFAQGVKSEILKAFKFINA